MKSIHKYIVLFFAAAALSVSGCGIKPKDLDPPPGGQNTQFPQTYPKAE